MPNSHKSRRLPMNESCLPIPPIIARENSSRFSRQLLLELTKFRQLKKSKWRRRSEMWGIVPAAGKGSRIQPLAFSKELLPVGSHFEDGAERPRAVSEYLV